MNGPGSGTRLVAGDGRCPVCDGYGFFWRYPRWGMRYVEDNPPVRVDCPACRGTGRKEVADGVGGAGEG
jgi:DnaJ-class molecular chaperone